MLHLPHTIDACK